MTDMVERKLTEAQRAALIAASRPGGVVGFGQKYRVVGPLRRRGFLEPNTRNYGYMVITEAGRSALARPDPTDIP